MSFALSVIAHSQRSKLHSCATIVDERAIGATLDGRQLGMVVSQTVVSIATDALLGGHASLQRSSLEMMSDTSRGAQRSGHDPGTCYRQS
jgi:hypothetical protein